jgi:hypothetical protein
MQVQIHQRVKILKKDLLWVLSVEGRGGDRMIKAFGHNLKVSIHPPTHGQGFHQSIHYNCLGSLPPILSWVVTTKLDECLVTINTNNTPHSPTLSISQKTGYTKATLRIVSHNKEKLFSIIISPYVRVLEKHIDSECLKFIWQIDRRI